MVGHVTNIAQQKMPEKSGSRPRASNRGAWAVSKGSKADGVRVKCQVSNNTCLTFRQRMLARTKCGEIAKQKDVDLDLEVEVDEVMDLEMEVMSLEVQEIGRRQRINCRDTMTSRSRFQKDWQVRVKSRMKEQWRSLYHASHVDLAGDEVPGAGINR